jgi:hypothetical protein
MPGPGEITGQQGHCVASELQSAKRGCPGRPAYAESGWCQLLGVPLFQDVVGYPIPMFLSPYPGAWSLHLCQRNILEFLISHFTQPSHQPLLYLFSLFSSKLQMMMMHAQIASLKIGGTR